jgi:hypothetical protein
MKKFTGLPAVSTMSVNSCSISAGDTSNTKLITVMIATDTIGTGNAQ